MLGNDGQGGRRRMPKRSAKEIRAAHHHFAVVKRRANQNRFEIIFVASGQLASQKAGLCNDAMIVYNCW